MGNKTISYYENNADMYIEKTQSVDMGDMYSFFLKHIPKQSKILDFGCGSGRDSKAFIDMGYDVTPLDGCKQFCQYTTKLTGRKSLNKQFNNISFNEEFDGVWACASLLHLDKPALVNVLQLIYQSLKKNGVIYCSFKYGDCSEFRDGRYFIDLKKSSLTNIVDEVGYLELLDYKETESNGVKWINAILKIKDHINYEFLSKYLKVDTNYLKQFKPDKIELAYLAIGKLQMRFKNKIDFDKYYLSYSGGRDSHLLYWFIKDFLKDDTIEIVGLNTCREHNQIRERIYKYSDKVLLPSMSMKNINEEYGMPCFTKEQDFFIGYYQKAIREGREVPKSYKAKIEGTYEKGFGGISKKARELVLSDKLHKVSAHCCTYTKKEPFHKYEKKSGRKAILGIRGSESSLRKTQYQACLAKNGKFTPLYDFTDKMVDVLEKLYEIEVPPIYQHIPRTGCLGCPYGKNKDILQSLELATKNQVKFAVDSFEESYRVIGIYDEVVKILKKKEVNLYESKI